LNKKEIQFISDVKDATGRKYKGYYDSDTDEYILKYKILTLEDEIRKKSYDIENDLFSPFTELKLIHNP